MDSEYDVVVVGAGNAAMCAALAAREQGCTVLVLDRASESEAGGNSRYTAGLFRVVYNDVNDLKELIRDLSDEEIAMSDFGTYKQEDFYEDLARVTEMRCDPDLTEVLVTKSHDTIKWLGSKGVRFTAAWGRQAFNLDGKFRFWGGLTVEAVGGGPGLIQALYHNATLQGIEIRFSSRAIRVQRDVDGICGVAVRRDGIDSVIRTRSVVLACGGFESNAAWRAQYLGPDWDLAKVRGTRFNTGDGLRMAAELDAAMTGNWSGCHAVAWDSNAPAFGDLSVGDGYQKHSYPWGVYLNRNGQRFVDEGANFRNYTYAKYGRLILRQPGQVAWQLFDGKVLDELRDEYRIRQVTKYTADTLQGLIEQLPGIDVANAMSELYSFNNAIRSDVPFNPSILDGRSTSGLVIPKSNWANAIDTPPFLAFEVTCGITFTFGGVRIDTEGCVLDTDGRRIDGLYAAGEVVGGVFWFNYAGGSGLTNGAVFGRRAGYSAASYSLDVRGAHSR